jgi:hypothetical protein
MNCRILICCFSQLAFTLQATVVRLDVLDTSGKPLPARVHLKDSAGKAHRPAKLPFWRDHFVCEGRTDLELAPGNYIWQIERGPEFSVASGALVLGDQNTNIAATLSREHDLTREGWWSGELHVHRPVEDASLLMRAEDLHVAHVITWWNESNLWKERSAPRDVLTQFDGTRFSHVMAGEDERGGGALLYLNLSAPIDLTGSKREFPSPMKFLREAHSRTGAHADIEKPFWWDTPLWLASGLVNTIGIAHNHMHRSGVLDNEAWGRPRDRAKYPGPQGNGRYTQDIYYHLLNCGLRVPPSAGSASGVLPNPVGYNRVYVHCGSELTWDSWHAGLRAGRSFVSNGPLLRCRANGQLPGHLFRTNRAFQVDLEVKLDGRDATETLELVSNGKIHAFERTKPVTIQESGWFLIRAVANVTNTFRFASTAPWYVELSDRPMAPRPESAQFFADWCAERVRQLQATNLTSAQREEILIPWREAEKFWQEKAGSARQQGVRR